MKFTFEFSIKAQCYSTLMRPTNEYASSVWCPAKKENINKKNINKLETVQRRAARFATGDYQSISSVTSMLQQLQWQSLQTRRERTQVVMLYRIVYRVVDITAESYLHPASLRTRGHTLHFLVPHQDYSVHSGGFRGGPRGSAPPPPPFSDPSLQCILFRRKVNE